VTVEYTTEAAGVRETDLGGFFVGWPSPPSPAQRLALLRGAAHVVLARVDGRLAGFVTALSDGVLCASIPLLEVLPEFQRQGLGKELVRRVLAEIGPLYAVDLACDDDLVDYYRSLGFAKVNGMVRRNAAGLG
jgi:ribosomal protein S18 acetylase RimI-like enzyme